MITFNFSFISVSNQLLKRNLNDDNNKFLLIGFGEYHEQNQIIYFNVHLLKYEANENYSDIYFNASVIYQETNTSEDIETKCSCQDEECKKQILTYNCEIKNDGDKIITNISLNNYQLKAKNFSGDNNKTFNEDQIILSTLANSTRKNIENRFAPVIFNIFYLYKDPIIKKDEVELNGNISWDNDREVEKYFYFNLSMPENVTCHYHHNYSGNNIDKIIFSPQKNVNVRLNAMMAKKNYYNNEYILIYANNSDDLILYSTVKSSSADLYGFENYTKYENKSAENVAVFFGTSNILKKYLRFPASVRYGTNSTLRFLEVLPTNATGTILADSTDIDNGIFKYRIVFPGTENISNILGIYYSNDFQFSDDGVGFTREEINIVGDYINLTNTDELEKPVLINFSEGNPTVDEKSFSFQFRLNSKNSNINITNKQPIFLNYSSMETSERDEIDSCTIENNTNIFTINCEPKKDIYTLLNSLIIKVPNVTTNRRLRFLQSSGNSTIRAPKTAQGDIQFDYNPEVNTFGRKSSKKKGLSGGAIAAIVLATIAAVVAVGVAIFFLNRGPINPIKTSTEMNLPNSTTNINN